LTVATDGAGLLDLFLAMFLIAFICSALVVGIFAARFGEDLRKTMGHIYIAVGLLCIAILLWLAGLLPVAAPGPVSFGLDRVIYAVFLMATLLAGTVVGLVLVFLTTLSSE
jgi:hypothetical protein